MTAWNQIAAQISAATGHPFEINTPSPRGGGSINQAWMIESRGQRYFVKLNQAHREDMFAAEAEGLNAMAATGAIKVPEALCRGVAGEGSFANSFIVMDYLDTGPNGDDTQAMMGTQLAKMHHTTQDRFGWHRNNTIGSTPQINDWSPSWIDFWREHRLGYQLDLARTNGAPRGMIQTGERLMEEFPALFTDYQPVASLLHGDLWGGNAAADQDGNPVIFDPATYYGDREADIAMTELFGGFSQAFYSAYKEAWPLDHGYAVRKILYNTYHLLNHFNLFGSGYVTQAQSSMERVLSEIR